MSARHKHFRQMTDQLCRLCVVLAREDDGPFRTIDEIISDARALLTAGDAARGALAAGKSPRTAYATASKVAARYKAFVVESGDLNGMVLGLRLTSGQHVGPAGALVYVA